jgi:hypothetical protein
MFQTANFNQATIGQAGGHPSVKQGAAQTMEEANDEDSSTIN